MSEIKKISKEIIDVIVDKTEHLQPRERFAVLSDVTVTHLIGLAEFSKHKGDDYELVLSLAFANFNNVLQDMLEDFFRTLEKNGCREEFEREFRERRATYRAMDANENE